MCSRSCCSFFRGALRPAPRLRPCSFGASWHLRRCGLGVSSAPCCVCPCLSLLPCVLVCTCGPVGLWLTWTPRRCSLLARLSPLAASLVSARSRARPSGVLCRLLCLRDTLSLAPLLPPLQTWWYLLAPRRPSLALSLLRWHLRDRSVHPCGHCGHLSAPYGTRGLLVHNCCHPVGLLVSRLCTCVTPLAPRLAPAL